MLSKKIIALLLPIGLIFFLILPKAPKKSLETPFTVTAYYAGNAERISAYPVEKLTHIIFSFCHLDGNRLAVDNEEDSLTIRKLVGLKNRNPQLKVLLSLGGWGGCETCSAVFSSAEGRQEFARSVKALQEEYGTDGLDLDWEYPGISGYPEHPYKPEDTPNFTLLVKELRSELGDASELSFAAGASERFFENSCEWDVVMPMVDRVNIMTYDFRGGGSTTTGHHTSLYSNINQKRSADYAIRYLDSIGVPKEKMVIGAAFYGRIWEEVENVNEGLYQPAKYKGSVSFKGMDEFFAEHPDMEKKWDEDAHAPYAYDPVNQLFMSYDNRKSVTLKTRYAKRAGLNGIMFWQLGGDKNQGGLLDAIYEECISKSD